MTKVKKKVKQKKPGRPKKVIDNGVILSGHIDLSPIPEVDTKVNQVEDDIKMRQKITQELKTAIGELVKETLENCNKSANRSEQTILDMKAQHISFMEEVGFSYKKIEERIESWEEQFYYIFHNIKKNQFLYSHYPDYWVKSFADLKEALKYENEMMNQKQIDGA